MSYCFNIQVEMRKKHSYLNIKTELYFYNTGICQMNPTETRLVL